MRVSRREDLTHPFSLSVEDIRKIADALAAIDPKLVIEAQCADQFTRQFASVEDLAAYENTTARALRRLTIRTRYLGQSAGIEFDGDDKDNVTIALEGEEDVTVALYQMLKDRLEGMRPWYAPLWRVNFMTISLALPFVALLFIYVAVSLGFLQVRKPTATDTEWSIRGLWWGLIPGVTGLGITITRRRVFPIANFLIGQGITRYQKGELLRIVVVVGFSISVLASIVAAWVMR